MATAKATKATVDSAPADEFQTAAQEPATPVDPRRCVVNDGRCVGRAVNGVVCSYHANAYHPDGRPR